MISRVILGLVIGYLISSEAVIQSSSHVGFIWKDLYSIGNGSTNNTHNYVASEAAFHPNPSFKHIIFCFFHFRKVYVVNFLA